MPIFEGEAEDRVVAGSNPALGTLNLNLSLFCETRREFDGICSVFNAQVDLSVGSAAK